MKIYLASRYSRREELLKYKQELELLGHKVTSRWLLGEHQYFGTPEESAAIEYESTGRVGKVPAAAIRFAVEDLEDLREAETIICFTEEPRSGHSRGGRHVEFGYALQDGSRTIIVGPIENVFYLLADEKYDTWETAYGILRMEAK